jgi:phytoene desaturase
VVFERLSQPGGRATVFEQDGFKFDAGPTIVTAPFLLEELWSLCGKKFSDFVDLKPMDPFYKIRFDDGTYFNYSGDHEKMKKEIAKFSPNEVDSYDKFMAAAENCYKLGYVELGNYPYNSIVDLLRSIPSMIKMRAWRSIYRMVSGFFKNDKLRRVFSFHPLLIGGNPSSVTCVYSLIAALERRYGVHSAMGGTGAIIKAMVDLFESLGGKIVFNAEVSKIQIEKTQTKGVFLKNNTFYSSNIIVSNADTAWTYQNLIEAKHRKVWTNRKINKTDFSMSLFVWYFGTNKTYPKVDHHTILLGQKYLSLLDDIFKNKKLSKDFSLYLHRPTATDPGLAPDNCDSFYVLSPVPNLTGNIDWTNVVESYKNKIMAYLEDSLLPGLSDSIVTSKIMTPFDFKERYLAFNGAAFGIEPILTQSAWFRPHNQSEDIKGLYMVGAGTHPGAGIPGVLTSAKLLDKVIPSPQNLSNDNSIYISGRTSYQNG